MSVLICPGSHEPTLTQSFLNGLGDRLVDYLLFPSECYPAYSTVHILDFLRRQFGNPLKQEDWHHLVRHPLVFVSFSAGVVGSLGAAWAWQSMGGTVKAFIAIDGWGMPLWGNFPIHRLSHDHFTHWSSAVLGSGLDSFYADPPVSHLDLWRSPHTAQGWWLPPKSIGSTSRHPSMQTTAAEFLLYWIAHYEEASLSLSQ